MSSHPTVRLGEICRPRQWKTLSKKDLVADGFPVYGANGKIGFATEFTHSKPTLLIGCRGSCGSVHITEPFSYANGNAMALDELNEE
jgi:type I restriction enzyme S subunit